MPFARSVSLLVALMVCLGGCGHAPPDYSDLPVRELGEVYPQSVRVHVVLRGETLTGIAREYGVDLPSILRRNPGLEPDRILPGQKIILPPEAGR